MNTEAQYTPLKAPVPISLAFHSLTKKQKVCTANSAGSLSQSQTSAFKAREKKKKAECNYCLPFKSQGVILCGLSFFFFHCAGSVRVPACPVAYGLS